MCAIRLNDSSTLAAGPLALSLDRGLPESLRGIVIDEPVAEAMARVATHVHALRQGIEVGFALSGTAATLDRHAHVTDVQPLDSRSSLGSVEIEPPAFVAAVEALGARSPGAAQVLGVVHTHPGGARPARSSTDRTWHARLLDDHNRTGLRLELALDTEIGPRSFDTQTFYSIVMNEDAEIERATAYLLLRVRREGQTPHDFEYEIPLFLACGVRAPDRPRFTAQVSNASGWSYDVRYCAASERPSAPGGRLQ